MSVVRKTVSISEDIYKEAVSLSDNFSKVVNESLKEFIEKNKRKNLLSLAGSWSNFKEDGIEFVDRIREDDKKTSEKRMKEWDI